MGITVVGAVLAIGLGTTTVVNAVATEGESHRIESYGQRVAVDGGKMNVLITGAGQENVVLLPGFGTASPVLDFGPLVRDLATDHRVIVVEPFGYGLSDGTEKERTTENIVQEVHGALEALDVDRYTLMGHSIAGIYGIEYAARYPEEVTAFVGIDTSVPGQPGMDTEYPTGLMLAAKNLGLLRLMTAASSASDTVAYTDHAREQMQMLANRNSLSPTYLNEMGHIKSNFQNALGTTFPKDLPLLLFVVAENKQTPEWLELHHRQAASVTNGTVVPLPGEHYLHHTHADEVADGFRDWEGVRG
ncbi:alpha/beta fold hydrolase [Paenarthrobacter aurescens]|uniref:Alpha/beta hydrolase n=1 Tax=Paenarthrobacter aurescens TaxID=43663 RepID=A0A4Y3NGE5_PAEAU|nr:alpha/beta hydrolase [Paenarthrobacter aurescens]MDO6144560.1 alpha/beta hydrolase [Paenarthrobacter aurescens]MDO6148405.1 alpha/beta hydrolase [Paenarthrobacter aurescens]MDO6159651.1 alpha/beta hydrolase [Paenarthrobacter aurescens]MDO6164553.1 alpha/beta hydrolase [Paenarthrobacter aurescens]GEB17779.1 alpha/beta hydrolase [Paenarthrobacter aurescens]